MADFSKVRAAAQKEELIIHRGLVLLASIAGGAGLIVALIQWFSNSGIVANPQGIAGPISMGMMAACERFDTVAILVGGLLGALVGYGSWLVLGHLQKMISPLGALVVLKRAAIPFAVFLPQITFLCQGKSVLVAPVVGFIGLALGILGLAFFEKKDKRKIFFAHPTESDYFPASFFTHGSAILLGAGLGWYLQSLPAMAATTAWGLWFALGVGIAFWILSLLFAAGLGLVFSKQTFDQIYSALSLALLPFALLPLQTLGWVNYVQAGNVIAHHSAVWLSYVLPGLTGLGFISVLVVSLLRMRRLPVETNPSWEELFRALMLILGVPFLLYSVAFDPQGAAYHQQALAGSLDLFHEGESLGVAQAMLSGKLPFKEILLRHGFLADAVSGLAALQWFGPSVVSWRFLMVLLAPLGLVAIYLLAIFCLPWIWAVLLSIVVLTGHLGSIPVTRFFFPIVGFIFTLYFIQRGRWVILIFSGLVTVLSLIASHTAGVIAIVGNTILMTAYVLFGHQHSLKNRLTQMGIYMGATLVGMLPWWFYLGMTGSLGAYFENFSWVLNYYAAVYGLPLANWMGNPTISQIVLFALPPAVVILGTLMIIGAIKKIKQTNFLPWNVLVLVVLTSLLWLRFVTRSDISYLNDALPIAAMLMIFFIYRMTAKQRLLRGTVFALLLPIVFIPQSGFVTVPELVGSFGIKNKITVDDYASGQHERLEGLYLPAGQAEALDQMITYLEGQVGTTESYYDFSNQPLFYYLIPRKPVVKTLSTSTAATFEQQLEAIHHLASTELKAVIFQGTHKPAIALDGIPSIVRQYAISEYLLKTYSPATVIADWVMLTPPVGGLAADAKAIAALKKPIDLHTLPVQWGMISKYDPSQGSKVGHYTAEKRIQAVDTKGVTVTADGEKISVAASDKPVQLELIHADEMKSANVLAIDLKADGSLDDKQAVLSWGKDAQQKISFTLKGDHETHRYVFRMGSLPTWVFADDKKKIVLRFPGGGWTWERAVLLQVKDIPELAGSQSTPIESEKN